MRPRFTANSQGRTSIDSILDRMLETGESITRNHSADVCNRCDTISGALERVTRPKLVSALGEQVKQLVVLGFVNKNALNADAVLARILAVKQDSL